MAVDELQKDRLFKGDKVLMIASLLLAGLLVIFDIICPQRDLVSNLNFSKKTNLYESFSE